MDKYSVVFSAAFDCQLAKIEANYVDYGRAHTAAYIEAVVGLCTDLTIFPHRFREIIINGKTYRLFRHKAHMIFYQIIEDERQIGIVAVLPARSDFKRWL